VQLGPLRRVDALPAGARPARAPAAQLTPAFARAAAPSRPPPPAPAPQTRAAKPIPTLQLTVVINAVALVGLLVFITIPSALASLFRAARAAWQRRRAAARAAAGAPAPGQPPRNEDLEPWRVGADATDASDAVEELRVPTLLAAAAGSPVALAPFSFTSRGSLSLVASPAASPVASPRAASVARAAACAAAAAAAAAKAPPPAEPEAAAAAAAARRAWWVSTGCATLIGGLVALQAMTLMYASRFTLAYVVQLIFLLTPLLAAVFSRWALRQPTPRGLWPALAAALAGSALVIAGEWHSAAGAGAAAAGAGGARDLGIGLALAVVSMVLLASYLVLLQVTQHVVTGVQVMWGNTLVGIMAFLPLALAVEGTNWDWVLALTPFDWGVLVFAGFFIDALNTIWTQSCARVLGAAIISLFICFRLVSSVVGSIAVMGEVPHSPLVWAGMALVVACMTVFMGMQVLGGRKDAAAAGGAAEGAAKGDIEACGAPAGGAAAAAPAPPAAAAGSDSCLVDIVIDAPPADAAEKPRA
jgi:drug/metabolite transporter (DMT)-like permease